MMFAQLETVTKSVSDIGFLLTFGAVVLALMSLLFYRIFILLFDADKGLVRVAVVALVKHLTDMSKSMSTMAGASESTQILIKELVNHSGDTNVAIKELTALHEDSDSKFATVHTNKKLEELDKKTDKVLTIIEVGGINA